MEVTIPPPYLQVAMVSRLAFRFITPIRRPCELNFSLHRIPRRTRIRHTPGSSASVWVGALMNYKKHVDHDCFHPMRHTRFYVAGHKRSSSLGRRTVYNPVHHHCRHSVVSVFSFFLSCQNYSGVTVPRPEQ